MHPKPQRVAPLLRSKLPGVKSMAVCAAYPKSIFVAAGDSGYIFVCSIEGNDNCGWIAKPLDGTSRGLYTLAVSSATVYST